MAALTRDAILAGATPHVNEVLVPEWGGSVYVRGITGTQRDQWDDRMYRIREGKGTSLLRGTVAAWCICDADGKRVFNDADAGTLGNQDGAALDRIYDVALRLSGLGDAEVEGAGKNSDNGQSDASG